MNAGALIHPRTQETVEQCARRFLRIAVSPGASADRWLARNLAFKLLLHAESDHERAFYAAVHAHLSEG